MVDFLCMQELVPAPTGGTVAAADDLSVAAAEADVIVEAIAEDLEAKRDMFRRWRPRPIRARCSRPTRPV
jgi:3-hydroxyacyl-CoA dehydrogenase